VAGLVAVVIHGGSGFLGHLSTRGTKVLQFENMDAVKAWREQGAAELENNVGNKYAAFR
jgi:hypothetical protein